MHRHLRQCLNLKNCSIFLGISIGDEPWSVSSVVSASSAEFEIRSEEPMVTAARQMLPIVCEEKAATNEIKSFRSGRF